jgi:hypothetical protein
MEGPPELMELMRADVKSAATVRIRCDMCDTQKEYEEARQTGWKALKNRPWYYRCGLCIQKGS